MLSVLHALKKTSQPSLKGMLLFDYCPHLADEEIEAQRL